MSNLKIVIVILLMGVAALAVRGHFDREALEANQIELTRKAAAINALAEAVTVRNTQIAELKKQLVEAQAQIHGLNGQATAESAQLLQLEASLEAQRKRAEGKRHDYEALAANQGGNPTEAAKHKQLSDELQTLNQQLKSVSDEIARTSERAQAARQNHKVDASFANSQEVSRIQSAQQIVNELKSQRAAIPRGRGNPEAAQQVQAIDQQIVAAQTNLNALKAENAGLQGSNKSQAQVLDQQIRKAQDDLRHDQEGLKRSIQLKQNELLKIDSHSAAAGQFQKERAGLLGKLAAELKDETDKLSALETQVRLEKAKLTAPTHP